MAALRGEISFRYLKQFILVVYLFVPFWMIITLAYSIHNNPSIIVYLTIRLCIFDFLILFFRTYNYALIFI